MSQAMSSSAVSSRARVRILTADAPPPAVVLHRTESIGFEVSHGYGLTETDIVDGETGRSVPRDGFTMGEIVLRGGCVMLVYLDDDKATKAIRDNEWFYMGDVGVMHPDG
jgi:acyl-CoA synthetase (AMP-forming)/AMP-acid ligase II